ncbi:MAG: glycoside hydrolase family 15 protein [Fulvimarina manganoxydans]|uniref:glycoside hydrolase family 15 protein n=1 Tax=Fulvimarina manganoxydans TaxID=937218 RepID=UPI00235413C0|nr:glycoside hydrolase family 15 protein [Fulvimarina manganoxydans]MCK5931020.1 glycoside hydrolase family 15 protein [Fulvimarina manganoxydans]
MTRRIDDYAIIGDCQTAALVSRSGSIVWLCLPRFDSASVFASLLGNEENGRWSIAPRHESFVASRSYREGTLILETTFRTPSGSAMLVDFMPPCDGLSSLVRIVVGLEGSVDFAFDLAMRFDYGRSIPWVRRVDDRTMTAIAGPDALVLRSPVELRGEDMHTKGEFAVASGERIAFTLAHQPSHLPPFDGTDPEAGLADTERFWREFSDRCPDVGAWTKEVKRSLVTLKALTYAPTGGIVAAATTSLPETMGGERNWDYRFCWLRDATLTLMAFMDLGYFEEADAWRSWLMRAVAGDPAQMQIMYGVAGERHLLEWHVPWLDGFRASRPVRIGNAAAEQFQIDVYGEVADMLLQARSGGLAPHPRSAAVARVVMPFLEEVWRRPDEGIWEVRGDRRHFVHSKVMAWVAFDRSARMAAETEGGEILFERWRRIADEIRADVIENGFDEDLGSFVQSYGSKALDASLLHIPMTGFLPADDPRVVGTVRAIEERLMRDGFVLRYDTGETDDGLSGEEGAFLACSFWLADVYILQNRYEDALRLFERLIAVSNDLGLLAEEYDPRNREMLGNFPQAFSHVGLIVTALNLSRAKGPADERAEAETIAATDA